MTRRAIVLLRMMVLGQWRMTSDTLRAVVGGLLRWGHLHVRVVTRDARQGVAAATLAGAARKRLDLADRAEILRCGIGRNKDPQIVGQNPTGVIIVFTAAGGCDS